MQKLFPKSLKHLAEEVLDMQIQGGEHDSVRSHCMATWTS
jgi:hypothetical protein